MNNITSRYDYVKKEVPDPQVKDVADQFFDAAEILWVAHSGVLIPAIINSVLAIELYLKSLNAYSVIKNLQDYGDGVRGGLVTVEPETSRHELTRIFESLEGDVKIALETAFARSSIFTSGVSFKDCLRKYDDAFIKVRYVYEDSTSFRRVNNSELQQLMKLTRSVVELLPCKTVVLK
jgi:hypothetical protein